MAVMIAEKPLPINSRTASIDRRRIDNEVRRTPDTNDRSPPASGRGLLRPTAPSVSDKAEAPLTYTPPYLPSHRRQRTQQAIKALLLRESQVQPVLVVFENLYWIEAETQALLKSLLGALDRLKQAADPVVKDDEL
jgi:hypothetical protein